MLGFITSATLKMLTN